MEFGPEINEDRPTWLDVSESVWVKWSEPDQWSGNKGMAAGPQMHSPWIAFRLPADHSYYKSTPAASPTPDERAVAPELVARLVALAERMSKDWTYMPDGRSFSAEARAIVAALELVDPVEEAFTTLDVFLAAYPDEPANEPLFAGDDLLRFGHLRTILAARGRQLEKEGK